MGKNKAHHTSTYYCHTLLVIYLYSSECSRAQLAAKCMKTSRLDYFVLVCFHHRQVCCCWARSNPGALDRLAWRQTETQCFGVLYVEPVAERPRETSCEDFTDSEYRLRCAFAGCGLTCCCASRAATTIKQRASERVERTAVSCICGRPGRQCVTVMHSRVCVTT